MKSRPGSARSWQPVPSTRPVDGWYLTIAWDADLAIRWVTWVAIAIALAGWIDGWLGWLIAGAGMLSLAIAAVVIARRALEATDYDCLFAIHGL